MTRPSRESIMSALASAVFAVAEFKTTGRRVQFWKLVSEQPACFLRNVKDEIHRQGIQSVLVMHCEVWIYCQSGADDVPGTALNNLIDDLETAFVPDNTTLNTFTLGGLVQHCWIEGEVAYDPGDVDKQAKAVVPVLILVP